MNKADYKNVYVFIEQREGIIQPVALELLGKARDLADSLGEKVVAMFLGNNITSKASELIAYGADDVVCVDSPLLENYLTEEYSQAIYQLANAFRPSIILIGATTIGRDLCPRLTARLKSVLHADCHKCEFSD